MMHGVERASERRQLGRSNLSVSPVAFGAWSIAGMTSLDVNDSDSLASLHAALDCGINFFDTAHCYGPNGESEILVGRAIRELVACSRRDEIVIASKGGIHCVDDTNMANDARPETIVRECDESLRRLGVDVIDLHYLHRPDPKVPVAESAGAFLSLVEAGKVQAVGASNVTLEELTRFHEVCPVTAIQPFYNLLQRGIEADLIPWCLKNQVSVCCYRPLGKGLLAGKIRRGHKFDPNDKRQSNELFVGEEFEKAQQLLDELDEIAAATGKSVTQLVVNWTISQPGITVALCGAKRDWQIRDSAGAMGWKLDNALADRIESVVNPGCS